MEQPKLSNREWSFCNFRPFLFLASAFVCGIAGALFWLAREWLSLFVAIGLLLLLLCLTLLSQKRKFVLIFLLVSLLGALYLPSRVADFQSVSPEGNYVVHGTVREKWTTQSGYALELENISLDGRDVAGNLIVYLTEEGEYRTAEYGDRATTECYVSHNTEIFSEYGFAAYTIVADQRYIVSLQEDESLKIDKSFDLFHSVRQRFYDTLFENMRPETASVAYALLFGNTDFMEDGILTNIRYGGIAHLFAVSGLHIGIVYGALALLFRKLHCRPMLSLCCIAPVLFLYVAVCGFSPSSLRAFFMCLAAGVFRSFGFGYDSLESLGFAVCAVLLIQPVHLFTVGFQLSVLACLGIALFEPMLRRRLSFFPKTVASGMAMSLSVDLMVLPVLLDTFGYLSPVSLLLNVVLLPLVMPVFLLLLAATLLGALVPVLGGGLLFPQLFLQGFLLLMALFDFSALLLCGVSFGLLALVYYLAVCVCSGKFRIGLAAKLAVCAVCGMTVLCGFFAQLDFGWALKISHMRYYGTDLYLIRTEHESLLIVDGTVSSSRLDGFLFRNGVTQPDVLLLPETYAEEVLYRADEVVYGSYCSETLLVTGTDGFVVETEDLRVAVGLTEAEADWYVTEIETDWSYRWEDGTKER